MSIQYFIQPLLSHHGGGLGSRSSPMNIISSPSLLSPSKKAIILDIATLVPSLKVQNSPPCLFCCCSYLGLAPSPFWCVLFPGPFGAFCSCLEFSSAGAFCLLVCLDCLLVGLGPGCLVSSPAHSKLPSEERCLPTDLGRGRLY